MRAHTQRTHFAAADEWFGINGSNSGEVRGAMLYNDLVKPVNQNETVSKDPTIKVFMFSDFKKAQGTDGLCALFKRAGMVVMPPLVDPSFSGTIAQTFEWTLLQARACGAEVAVPIDNMLLRSMQCTAVHDHLHLAQQILRWICQQNSTDRHRLSCARLRQGSGMADGWADEPTAAFQSQLLRETTETTLASWPNAAAVDSADGLVPAAPLHGEIWSSRSCFDSQNRFKCQAYDGRPVEYCRFRAVTCCGFDGSFQLHMRLPERVPRMCQPMLSCVSRAICSHFQAVRQPYRPEGCTERFRVGYIWGNTDDNNLAHYVHDSFAPLWLTYMLTVWRDSKKPNASDRHFNVEDMLDAVPHYPPDDVLLIRNYELYRHLPFHDEFARMLSKHPVISLDELQQTGHTICFDELVVGTNNIMHTDHAADMPASGATAKFREQLWRVLQAMLERAPKSSIVYDADA